MPWNPDIYNQFKNIRFKPSFDLMELIQDQPKMQAIDLGCGTGEQTRILSERFSDASFLGIDSSAEMLAQSKALEQKGLHFRIGTVETVLDESKTWDLVFSNAALQWSENHSELFLKIISKINQGGQLAVQIPCQNDNALNKIVFQLSEEEPYKTWLNGWNRPSPVLEIDEYAQILFENGLSDLQISQRIYPIIAENHDTLFNFISGSALIPYMERLNQEQQQVFANAFKEKIAQSFPKLPALYAFKRILLYGRKI